MVATMLWKEQGMRASKAGIRQRWRKKDNLDGGFGRSYKGCGDWTGNPEVVEYFEQV